MEDFQKSVEMYNYVVLGSDSTCNAYSSLRNISNEINVDYSTISKKLKQNNLNCFVSPKGNTEIHYYIIKIN